jgi:uncharacterized protein (DUF2267 family)
VHTEEGKEKAAAKPRDALFRVVLALDTPPPARRVQLVEAVIEAEAQSLWERWGGALLGILIRESGF